MADIQWAAPKVSLTGYLSTSLNALANDALDLGAAINNETNRALYMDLEMHLGSVDLSAQPNPTVEAYLIESIDGGTTYDTVTDASTTDAAHPTPDKLLTTFAFRLASGAEVKNSIKTMLLIPPGYFMIALINRTGGALAGTLNTLQYRTYAMESV